MKKIGFHLLNRVIPALMGMTLLISCGREIEKVDKIENPDTIPAIRATDIETIYSDSSVVRLKINAPELKDFPEADSLDPKLEFPQGLTATFYNKSGRIESTLTADYAIYHSKSKVFEAKNNVLVKNLTEDQELRTSELWWNETTERIWSDKAVSITTADGTTIGEGGFTADQNFREYRIIKSRGQMKVKEPETSNQQPATSNQ
jgi:LPS export ABC transporter protein LptC